MAKNLYNNSVTSKVSLFTKYVLYPLGLLAVAFVAIVSFLDSENYGIKTLHIEGRLEGKSLESPLKLNSGDSVTGRFVSKYSNFSSLGIRVHNSNQAQPDILRFRITDLDTNTVLHESEINRNDFIPYKLSILNFPTIKNATGRYFEFEIKSTTGATNSGIVFAPGTPQFIVRSDMVGAKLVENQNELMYFLKNKFQIIYSNRDILIYSMISLLPLFLYIVVLLVPKSRFHYLVISVIGLCLLDINTHHQIIGLYYMSVVFYWLLIITYLKPSSEITKLIALVLLGNTLITQLLSNTTVPEKSALWSIVFVLLATFHVAFEQNKNISEKSGTKELAKLIKADYKKILDNQDFLVTYLVNPISATISALIVFGFIKRVYQVHESYVRFFPLTSNSKYFLGYLLPVALFTVVFVALFVRIAKNSLLKPYVVMLSCVIFWIVFQRINSVLTGFEKKPNIFSISPSSTSEVWLDVTINGKNFENEPFIGQVLVGKNKTPHNIILWSNEKIIFRTNPATTKTGDVCVQTHSKGSSNCTPFEYRFSQ